MAEKLASEFVAVGKRMTVYSDGTFTLKGLWGAEPAPDELLAFESDVDSMRRKSKSGRGAAALFTGGASLIASNNRGVVYATVMGAKTGTQTFTTRNPDGYILSGLRTLTTTCNRLIEQRSSGSTAAGDISTQIKLLADLHAQGQLSDQEFQTAKARLLG